MTNKELIEKYLRNKIVRAKNQRTHIHSYIPDDAYSYGFFVREQELFSVTDSTKAIAKRIPNKTDEGLKYILIPKDLSSSIWKLRISPNVLRNKHICLLHKIAEELKVTVVVSPKADAAYFQEYMATKFNIEMGALSSISTRFKQRYNDMIATLHTLKEGEELLGLPSKPIAVPDDLGITKLWEWLLKPEIGTEEERDLLRKTFVLSRLFPKT